jgi:hypothetical protein
MKWTLLESYLLVIRIEILLRICSFGSVHELVRRQTLDSEMTQSRPSCERLCDAINLACAFYPKTVLCLQRSAATTILLRRYGFAAEMVIGAQVNPFRAHAWVEVDGVVSNDKPYISQIYRELERC